MNKKPSQKISKSFARPIAVARSNRWVLFILLLSFLLFGIWGIRPLVSEISLMREEIEKGNLHQKSIEQNINTLKEAETTLLEFEEQISLLGEAVPDNRSQPEMMEELALDGAKSGFYLQSLVFPDTEIIKQEKGAVYPIPFTALFRSGLTGLNQFMEELSKGRLLRINSIRYGEKKKKCGTNYRVQLRLLDLLHNSCQYLPKSM